MKRKLSVWFKNEIKDISIKRKILLYNIAIIIVLSTLVTIFSNVVATNIISDKGKKDSIRELSLINMSVDLLRKNIDNYLWILSTDPRVQAYMTQSLNIPWGTLEQYDINRNVYNILWSTMTPYNYLIGGCIVGANGSFIEIGPLDYTRVRSTFADLIEFEKKYPNLDFDYSGKCDKSNIEFIKYEQDARWFGMTNLKYKTNRNASENVIVIAKVIKNIYTYENMGVIVLLLNEKYLSSIYETEKSSSDKKFYLLNGKDTIISSENKNDIFKGIKDIKIDKNKNLVTTLEFENMSMKSVSIIPMKEITYVSKQISKWIVICFFIGIIISIIISIKLSNFITKPILSLANKMKLMNKDSIDVRVKYNSKDEIGILGDGFNTMMDEINNLMEKIVTEQKFRREYEFKLLQSQVKPHFLYNTLETIISFVKIKMYDNALITTKALANFYRGSLSKGNDLITIKDEIYMTSEYLSIQKFRYEEYLDYKIEIEEEINGYYIPKLTLQPLVENAIYHGLKQKEDKGMLIITGYKKENNIYIEIWDNGVGISKEKMEEILKVSSDLGKKIDFGVGCVNSRIKILYGDAYGLTIDSKESEYTKIIIKLPCVVF